jgi:hypothetical protein
LEDNPADFIYYHLDGDLYAEVMERSGFKPKRETAKDNPLSPKIYMWCEEINPATNSFCSKCGRPVSDDAMKVVETSKTPVIQISIEMTSKERLEWLAEQIAELKATIAS